MTQMTDVYQLQLLADAREEEFVAFAEQAGFRQGSVTRAGTITSQYLLREHDGQDGARRFVWIVRWTLHFGMDALEFIGPSLWKSGDEVQSYAEVRSFARFVQVAEFARPGTDAAEP